MNETLLKQHEAYIQRCLALATAAAQAGDGPFAALVVREDQLIAEAANRVRTTLDVSAHAEIMVIRLATQQLGTLDLRGCTLYTNAEPCYMCSYAIRQARISQVVIGARAEARGGVSSRHPILAEPGILGWGEPPQLVVDVLLAQCTELLRTHGFVHI